MQYKRCKKCQRFFTPIKSDQVFCGVRCSSAFSYYKPQPLKEKICVQCGKSFTTRLSSQTHCADICRLEHYNIRNKEMVIMCLHCGKPFTTTDSREKYHKECRYPAKLIRENKRHKEKKNELQSKKG